jgi:cytochrome c biogenesis protein CcmG/thiol:disulfide interchange protein DsbE
MPRNSPLSFKTILPVLLLQLASSLPASADPATTFTLPDVRRNEVSLENFRGKVVYLDFWASWCGPCRQSFPWMNEMRAKYAEQGLVVIAVNLDADAGDAADFLAEHPAEFTVLYDAEGITPRSYEVKGMPTSYLISRDGQLVSRHLGFNVSDKQGMEDSIRELLKL